MKTTKILVLFAALLSTLVACSPSKDQLQKMLEENPEILTNAFEKNAYTILKSLRKSGELAEKQAYEEQAKEEEKRAAEEFAKPKTPKIADNRVITKGNKDAPVTIVEYSDFQCPYCSRGYQTVLEIMKNYPDKVRVIYKHLPLDFHPQADIAARLYEALALQDHKMAIKFHDMVFENQKGLSDKKEEFLKDIIRKVGGNVAKAMKDAETDAIRKIVDEDKAEAASFGFNGTPAFLVNGISVNGARPFSSFQPIIERHLAGGAKSP